MTPLGERASFAVYPFVDGSRRILGSNYGFAEPAIDFPRYAAWTLDGRLPVDRLIDRRIGLDDLEDAFAAMRRGRVHAPGHRLRLTGRLTAARGRGRRRRRLRVLPWRHVPSASRAWSRASIRSSRGCLIVPAVTAASRSAFTAPTIAALTWSYGTFCVVAIALRSLPALSWPAARRASA